MSSRYDIDRDGLHELLRSVQAGIPRFRVDQVWSGWYEHLRDSSDITTLPLALRQELDRELPTALTAVTTRRSDDDTTLKHVWQLVDGPLIESVLMLYPDRATVCVSSQAGCAMACGFCATGQAGFTRHLTTGEIVEQVVRASREARHLGRRLSNVVFMGMGEPLANETAVRAAVERLHDAMGMSARHLTVSTVGIVPGIAKVATWDLPVNLAVSLHAANDTLRDELVPINRRYPLASLMEACSTYLEAKGRRLSFEWAMIAGVNDRPSDAAELAERCRSLPLPAHVNLIPLNPTPGWPTVGSPPERIVAFRDALARRRVNATIRRNRGTEIDAACGQLAAGVRASSPVTMTPKRPSSVPAG
jgi:23S rRNA (adenine2503-C2)-methyltransferase